MTARFDAAPGLPDAAGFRPAADPFVYDPVRLATLAATGLVPASASGALPALDRVARLAARLTGAALAQVNVVTADAQVPVAACVAPGLDPAGATLGGVWRVPVGLDASYCQYVVIEAERAAAEGRAPRPLVVEDAREHPLLRDNRATREAGIRAYAAVAVIAPDRRALGSVCAVDFAPRAWTADDLAALEECAALAGDAVAARLSAAAALREREAFATALLDASPDCVKTLDLDGRLLTMNAAGCHLMEVDDVGTIEGADWAAFWPNEGAGFARAAVAAAREGREGRFRAYAPTFKGTAKWWDVRVMPVPDEAGRPRILLSSSRDVTAEVTAEAERDRLLAAERTARARAERLRDAAEAANRAKSDFLATMSHELRTPLNAIAGHVQLVELGLHGPVTGAQRDAFDRVQRAQRHLLALINDVLNYAKLQAGRVEYDVRPTRAAEVVREGVQLIEAQVAAKGLVLDVRLPTPGAADGLVWADREKLAQVLLNLLSNAVKFTPAERAGAAGERAPGRVTVQLTTRARTPDVVYLRVTDTGIGIPRDQQARIFDPFVQVHAGHTRPHEGTGLGLAISRDLARGMGGDLRVRSAPGEGATFTVTLRRVGDAEHGTPQGAHPTADGAPTGAEAGSARV